MQNVLSLLFFNKSLISEISLYAVLIQVLRSEIRLVKALASPPLLTNFEEPVAIAMGNMYSPVISLYLGSNPGPSGKFSRPFFISSLPAIVQYL